MHRRERWGSVCRPRWGWHWRWLLTHRQLLKEVWGTNYVNQSHYVRVYLAQLRQKIEADPARPRLLHTEPGVGYRLKDE